MTRTEETAENEGEEDNGIGWQMMENNSGARIVSRISIFAIGDLVVLMSIACFCTTVVGSGRGKTFKQSGLHPSSFAFYSLFVCISETERVVLRWNLVFWY